MTRHRHEDDFPHIVSGVLESNLPPTRYPDGTWRWADGSEDCGLIYWGDDEVAS